MRYVSLILFFFILSCNSTKELKKVTGINRPNVLFILTDDQGWGDLSINGNTNLSTPHIDNLFKHGVGFERFFVSPVCSPTRAEILTGRYHVRGGVYSTSTGGERLDLDEETIADVFMASGYSTGAFGKWHNGMQYPYHPNGRGFMEFYGFCSGHWGHYYSPMLEQNGNIVKGEGYLSDDITNKAIEFINNSVEAEKPFFAFLPYNIPHSPMQVPDRFWNKFENLDLDLLHRDAEKEDIIHTKAALAMCENIDWNVGRLVKELNRLNIEDNTIIIYLSDNGPNGWRWNGCMKGRKGSTDEGGIRSPLVIQWKDRIKGGGSVEQIASSLDFLPTLKSMCDISLSPRQPLDGKDISALIYGNDSDWEDRILISSWRDRVTARSQRFRLSDNNMLYDMENDPCQYKDVSESFPLEMISLMELKENWKSTVGSELPDTDERSFLVGHPNFQNTQIPARDGTAHGTIERSNRFPNDSFFRNWSDENDSITWNVEVVQAGEFEVDLYYTAKAESVGSTFQLSFGDNFIRGQIKVAHDPPLMGASEDRKLRQESYVKDFKKMELGLMNMTKGEGQLILKAIDKLGPELMEVRLLMFKRLS